MRIPAVGGFVEGSVQSMALLGSLRSALRQQLNEMRGLHLYRRFKGFTMIPSCVFVENLALAARVKQVEGCIVECGVWRGGMSAAIAALLGPKRKYYLFDSFEGLPPAKEIDGAAALAWQQDKESPFYYGNCSASCELAIQAMGIAGATEFEIVPGWFNETVPAYQFEEPIALLRLDADWYESTMICLENLFDRVAPGGLVIIDDYYAWDGCSRAVHDFLSCKSATERIRSMGSVCFLIKAAKSMAEQRPEHEDRLRSLAESA